MDILVTTGTGEGPTPSAAYDAALLDAGVADYNLICLSSVIPANGVVQRVRYVAPRAEYGHRLYAVVARHEAQHVGQQAFCGLGWTQDKQLGRGVFAEARGRSRAEVERDLVATLAAKTTMRALACGPVELAIAGVECRDRPVCAVAIAVYRAADWGAEP